MTSKNNNIYEIILKNSGISILKSSKQWKIIDANGKKITPNETKEELNFSKQ